jgi:hypothetical protein
MVELWKYETSRKRRYDFSEKCTPGKVQLSWARIKSKCLVGLTLGLALVSNLKN